MKKIFLMFTVLILTSNIVFAANPFEKLTDMLQNKPTKNSQERLAPVKKTYDDELTKSEQARILYNENSIKAAFDTLLSINDMDRTCEDLVLLGNILQDQQKPTDAIFMYQRAITKNSKNFKPYYNMANIYLEMDKPNLAIENYRKANKCNPQFAYAYYNLGCAYLKIGELKKAKIVFLKAIELKNNEPDFYYNVAYTYKQLKKVELAKQYIGFYNKIMANNNNQEQK